MTISCSSVTFLWHAFCLVARGEKVRLVPTWRGAFDTSMAGDVLLPGDGARLGPITFEDWLTDGPIDAHARRPRFET